MSCNFNKLPPSFLGENFKHSLLFYWKTLLNSFSLLERKWTLSEWYTLCEKCLNMEFFLVRIFPYSVQMRENTDQKKLRLWTLFTQCSCFAILHVSFRSVILQKTNITYLIWVNITVVIPFTQNQSTLFFNKT